MCVIEGGSLRVILLTKSGAPDDSITCHLNVIGTERSEVSHQGASARLLSRLAPQQQGSMLWVVDFKPQTPNPSSLRYLNSPYTSREVKEHLRMYAEVVLSRFLRRRGSEPGLNECGDGFRERMRWR